MSRPLRKNVVGGWYHVTSRGHNRRAIFLDDGDRRHFLSLLESMIEMHRVEVHGYVLMDNHYHLLVCTPEANLSEAIQWLNVSYSIWWNRRHQQCGSLYQGRFKAVLVEGGGWLLRLSQYIHYNPVAIQGLGMGKQEKAAEQEGWRKPTREEAQRRVHVLREYLWSSYRAYAGYEKGAGWLSTATILRRVKGGRNGYRKMTESYLLCGHDKDFWGDLKWGFVLGSTKFAESIRAELKIDRETSGRGCLRRRLAWDQVVRCMEDIKGEPWAAFADKRGDWGRDMILWAARRLGGYTLKELADEVGGLDYSAIYQAVRRLESRASKDKKMAARMQSFRNKLKRMYNV